MLTVVAFLIALGLLIAVHEYGHYRVAVACGVKVLRFSIGFGPTLWRWKPRRQRRGQDTEFTLAALPLGGFVRMLDEREGPVDPAERHLAFNTQPLKSRAAIVAAGPAANLLLAVLLYAAVHWIGMQEPQPVLGTPVAGSLAEAAGLRGGERVTHAGFVGDALQPIESFEEVRWLLTRGALDGRDLRLQVARDAAGRARAGEAGSQPAEAAAGVRDAQSAPRGSREVLLPLSRIGSAEADAQLLRKVGLQAPWTAPQLGDIVAGGAAERAGLRKGDIVVSVGGQPVGDAQHLRELIRGQVRGDRAATAPWEIERAGARLRLAVTPELAADASGRKVGRIGAYVGAPPAMLTVRHGPLEGLWKGIARTWEVSELTVRMIGRMIVGEASLRNLSGPLTIADYAGKSASLGVTQYILFLALISVSLGVLNLLPLPVLDGGHLMYYLWEAITGRSISDAWMERLQRGGVAVLLGMMSIALFNDVTRLFG